jgi:hypothetical protein
MNQVQWSDEWAFIKENVNRVPESAGIYEILQSSPYPRYKGETCIVKIGSSEKNLCQELHNHFTRHTAANRISRIRGICKVSFRYKLAPAGEVEGLEKQLLREFEDEHWDLPVCNSTRGYGRGEDIRYRSQVMDAIR